MLSLDEEMLDIVCPAGKFDENLNLLGGNNELFSFLGERIYGSLYKIIKESDKERLEAAVERSKTAELDIVEECIHIDNECDGYDTYMLTIRKNSEKDEYLVQFINITESQREIFTLSERRKKARDFLTLAGETLFEFFPEESRFRLYWVNHEQTVEIYNGDIDAWKSEVVSEKWVEQDEIEIFNLFVESIKADNFNDSYKFHGRILSGGDRLDAYRIKPLKRVYNATSQIIGTWSVINEFTGDPIENFMEDSCMDPLTRLLNKKTITEYAKNAVKRVGEGNLSVAVMDIDDFKSVNDTYGHAFGDKVLTAVAGLIKKALGDKGVAGRMGGDEFMIIVEDFNNELELRNILRCIKINMSSICQGEMGNDKLSCSIGASRYRRDSFDYDGLFGIADKALYIAKQKGKNRYIIYEEHLHGQFILNDDSATMTSIREGIYSEKDMLHINKLMADVIVHGEKCMQALFDKTADILMVDRVYMFYGETANLRCLSRSKTDNSLLSVEVLRDEGYLKQLTGDLMVYNNTNTVEYSMPGAYRMFTEAGIGSTMIFTIRDMNGEIKGMICADMCTKRISFPGIAKQLFDMVCQVVRAVLVREN